MVRLATALLASVLLVFGAAQIVNSGTQQGRVAADTLHPLDQQGSASARTASIHPQQGSVPAGYDLIFSAEPGPDMPLLQVLAEGSTSDAEIAERAAEYFDANRERLAALWREDNPTRLAGIFSMYLVHVSTDYGETTFPASLTEYVSQTAAHCGTYTFAQWHIASALGLTWRIVEFVGEHAWLEIYVDDHWELFDATTNTWIDQGIEPLLRGEARQYRQFYTPLLDADRPEARAHMALGYDMQRLRQRMPTLGIVYMPPGEMKIGEAVRPDTDR